MANRADVAFLGVFAAGMGLAGAWVLSKPALVLQTRDPRQVLHLQGLAQFLFAAGPMLAGATLALAALRVARGGELRSEAVTILETVCFLLGIACLLAGLFFTSKTFRLLLGLRSGSPLVTSNAGALFRAEKYFETRCVQHFV